MATASETSLVCHPGAFQILETLGEGGFGKVFKVKHKASGQFYAVKSIKLNPGDDFSKVKQEILLLKKFDHRNIVAYYGCYVSKDNKHLCICLEFCGGGSLQDIYLRIGALTELEIAYACKETLKGLQYLHTYGVLHRDIKGANILLTSDGDIKLADFGVSAEITATLSKRMSIIGTLHWMAPEIVDVLRNEGYNQLCDIWSLGITCIELAECEPPKAHPDPAVSLVLMSHKVFKPPSLRDKNKWSPEFQHFVHRALAKNPDNRPSAKTLLKDTFLKKALPKDIGVKLLHRNSNPETNASISNAEMLQALLLGVPIPDENVRNPNPQPIIYHLACNNLRR